LVHIARVTVICSGCRSRYSVELDWLSSAAEFACSCGARLEPNMEGLFRVRHCMSDRPEITLWPFRLDEVDSSRVDRAG
jgi:hypothetical protein